MDESTSKPPIVKPYWIALAVNTTKGSIIVAGFSVIDALDAENKARNRVPKEDKIRAFEMTDVQLAPDMIQWLCDLGIKLEDAIKIVQDVGSKTIECLRVTKDTCI